MILKSLSDLYDRLSEDSQSEITPLRFAPQKISFHITLKEDGSVFSIAPIINPSSNKKYVNEIVPEHHIRSGTKIAPQFLCDKATYCLGLDPNSGEHKGFEAHFNAFKQLHLEAELQIDHPDYSSFCRFLEKWDSNSIASFKAKNPDTFLKCINFGVFSIQGKSKALHEIPKIRTWWTQQELDESPRGQCLVTGGFGPIARLHPKIKGFASASSLVGIQKGTSYESYQLEQALTAPTSPIVAFKYASALNWLIDGKGRSKHRFYIGDTTCATWTDKPTVIEDALSLYFSGFKNPIVEAQDSGIISKLEILIKALRMGITTFTDFGENPDETNFFILGLEQPNPGRYSIRFFMKSSIRELINHLHDHHSDIAIIREFEENTTKGKAQSEFPSCRELINQTAVKLSSGKLDYKTIPPLLAGSLMRAILENTPYPEALYSAVIRRIRADRTINYLRAAIIKGILTRNHKQTITTMLDTENTDPAYLLGRLFASLEKTQTDALGDLNAGLRDKFYSSASATPASVFPRILRTYQHHLAKLKGGSKVNREKLIQEILSGIPATGFPSNLNLKDQGIFALGYYHQRKKFFTKKETTEDSQN